MVTDEKVGNNSAVRPTHDSEKEGQQAIRVLYAGTREAAGCATTARSQETSHRGEALPERATGLAFIAQVLQQLDACHCYLTWDQPHEGTGGTTEAASPQESRGMCACTALCNE